jgi:hypothetical protein
MYRYGLVVLMFEWHLFTQPLRFFFYSVKYLEVWYGPALGFLLVIWFPVMPFGFILY